MINDNSAVERTPVEVWVDIFESLLFEPFPFLFEANPFHSSCNYHTALRKWRDYDSLMGAARRRPSLRLVCRAWKDLVDSLRPWFYWLPEYHSAINMIQMRSAKRLHLDSSRGPCSCYATCVCHQEPCDNFDETQSSEILQDLFVDMNSRANILVITNWRWSMLVKAASAYDSPLTLPLVTALEVFDNFDLETPISILCPNLVYLNISLSKDLPPTIITLPSLLTLILAAPGDYYDTIVQWELPRLMHAEIEDNSGLYDGHDFLARFLEKTWPKLISLKAMCEMILLELPLGIWTQLPELQYLGLSRIYEDDYDIPPNSHPITTIANIEEEPELESTRRLESVSLNWKNVRVLADVHRWEKLRYTQGEPSDHRHAGGGICDRCVMNMVDVCNLRGIRYEDLLGRSLDEYLSEREGDSNPS